MKQRVISGTIIGLITLLSVLLGGYLLTAVLGFIIAWGSYETISVRKEKLNIDYHFTDKQKKIFNSIDNGMALKDGIIQCAKECIKNGVTLGMGTDAGCPYTTHYDLWRELEYFHHYLGISREESLHIATLGNAAILGLDNEIGSIEPGKSADFIVSSKNPLDNFDALRELDMVALKGNIIRNPRPKKSAEAEKELDNFYYNKLAND